MLIAAVALLSAGPACPAADHATALDRPTVNPSECLDRDVLLRAGAMQYFYEGGSAEDGAPLVCILEGSVELSMGVGRIASDRAVAWIHSRNVTGRTYRRIDLFLEGSVTVSEPDNTITRENQLVLTIMQTGDFVADVESARRIDGTPPPLYSRALDFRLALMHPGQAGQPSRPTTLYAPPAPPTRPEPTSAANQTSQPAKDASSDEAKPATTPDQASGPTPSPAQTDASAQAPIAEQAATADSSEPQTPPAAASPSGSAGESPPPVQPRQPVRYSADSISLVATADTGEGSEQTTVAKGHLLLSYGGIDGTPPVDVQADAGVLFTRSGNSQAGQAVAAAGAAKIVGAYLEGDVRMTSEDRIIRAERLYLNFETEQAIMLDAVFHGIRRERNLPIYVRAREVRLMTTRDQGGQATGRVVSFDDARLSTSEFYSPTYHIGVSEATLSDTTERDENGQAISPVAAELAVKDATFNVYGLPILYWPAMKLDANTTEVPLSRLNFTRDGDLGNGVETRWKFLRLLNLKEPEGFDADLELDNYVDGNGGGLNVDYQRDAYSGFLESYYLRDNNGSEEYPGWEPEAWRTFGVPTSRYRIVWRHKQYLPEGWELQGEYADERGDLTYSRYRDQFWEDKPEETLLYARKQRDDWALGVLGRADVFNETNTFEYAGKNRTEAAPELTFDLVGRSLFDDTATLFANARGGMYRVQDSWIDHFRPEGEGRMEIDLPIKLGPVNLVPSAGAAAMKSDFNLAYSGHLDAFAAVKINTTLWRTWPQARCRLLDINGLRHVVTPEAVAFLRNTTYEGPSSSAGGDDNHFSVMRSGTSLRLRQRWQTYRGAADDRAVVDLAGLNLGADFFSQSHNNSRIMDYDYTYHPLDGIGRFFFDRPERSKMANNLNGDFYLNISDSTALLGDAIYGLENDAVDWANLGLAVQRDPRLRYYVGARYIDRADLYSLTDYFNSTWHDSLVGTAGFTYNISRKYELDVFQQYDFRFKSGRSLASAVRLIRKFPRWRMGLSLSTDQLDGVTAIEFTVWPEGMPNLHLGSGPSMSNWASSNMN